MSYQDDCHPCPECGCTEANGGWGPELECFDCGTIYVPEDDYDATEHAIDAREAAEMGL